MLVCGAAEDDEVEYEQALDLFHTVMISWRQTGFSDKGGKAS